MYSAHRNIGLKVVYKRPKHVAILGCWWLCAIVLFRRHKPFYFEYWNTTGCLLLKSSLCSLFHSPVTSSIVGPNILLNTLASILRKLNTCLFSLEFQTTVDRRLSGLSDRFPAVNRVILFIIKPTRCTNFANLFFHETLHVSDSSSVHHQEFIQCILSKGICHTGL
jgi:hypothetical protein